MLKRKPKGKKDVGRKTAPQKVQRKAKESKMADEQEKSEEQRRREADAEHRGAGSGEEAVRRRGGGAAAYRTGGSKDDGGTGTTGAAEEEGESGGGGDDEEEAAELPQEMFPEGKSETDYEPDNYNPESEYPAGDPSKGMPDYTEIVLGKQQFISFRDYRAYLVSQAVKNERANDEIYDQWVKGAGKASKVAGILMNPDFQRDTSMESVLATMPDPMHTKEYIENFKKQRMEDQKKAAEQHQGA